MVSSSSSSSSSSYAPTKENLLCKFDSFCEKKGLTGKQIDKEANRFFAWCMAKGYEHCVFPEYLAAFVKGNWCPYVGYC